MMRRRYLAIPVLLAAHAAVAQDKITYQDHVRPIFAASCLSCHNPDKAKADLDLSTYQSTMKGSSNGKIVQPGDPDGSLIYLLTTFQEEPHMPQKASKLPDAQLEVLKKWIAGGALESSGSVAAASKPKVEMKLATAPTAKPQGAPPMPKDLSLDPLVRSDRAAAPGAMASSPWAPLVAFSAPHQILLYQEKTQQLLGVLPFPEGLAKALRFSRNGSVLLAGGGVGGQSGRVALYDVVTGRRIAEIGEEFDEVLAADISPDQSTVALGGPGKKLKLYPTTGGKPIHEMSQHTDWVTAVAYSPDGVLLASGDRNGGLRVWEAASGNEFYTLNGHKAAITHVTFRGDSNVLASTSEDGTLKLWDMSNGKPIKSVAAHAGGALSVDFATDGRMVTSGRDKIVRVWKPDGAKLSEFAPFKDIALHAVFGQDGATVISDDFTGTVRINAVADGKAIGELDVNPPTIAERLVQARQRFADAEALATRASNGLTAAKDAIAKATTELASKQAAVAELKAKAANAQTTLTNSATVAEAAAAALDAAVKLAGQKQADRDRLASVATQAHPALAAATQPVAATTQPVENPALAKSKADVQAADDALAQGDAALAAAKQDVETKRAASVKAAAEKTTFADAAKAAQAILASASASMQSQTDALKAANENLPKAQAAADAARQQSFVANAELLKWKQAETANEMSLARRELEDLSARAARVTQGLAQIESASKTIAESPQRIAAAEQNQAKARAAISAALIADHASHEAVIALESAAVKFDAVARPLRTIHPFSSLLQQQVRNALQSADGTRVAVKQAADASTAADTAVAVAKAAQEQAPKLIAEAKASIASSLSDRIEAAKAKLEQLSQQASQFNASR